MAVKTPVTGNLPVSDGGRTALMDKTMIMRPTGLLAPFEHEHKAKPCPVFPEALYEALEMLVSSLINPLVEGLRTVSGMCLSENAS
jgi:hypothetical protein